MSIFGNNSGGGNEVSPNTFQTSAVGTGKPKTTVSSKERSSRNANLKEDARLQAIRVAAPDATFKAFNAKYDRNENDNQHSENVVWLAHRYGTKKQINEAISLYNEQEKAGSLTDALYARRRAIEPSLTAKFNAERNRRGLGDTTLGNEQ